MIYTPKYLISKANKKKYNRAALDAYVRKEFMENGLMVIHIDAPDGKEIFHPLSFGHQRDLSNEIYDYIEQRSAIIPVIYPIKCVFHNAHIPEEEKKGIVEMMQEHYKVMLYDKAWDRRINRYKMIGLALFGLTLLVLWLRLSGSESIYSELLSIIASFSLWEAVDLFLLERLSIKAEMLNLAQLMAMHIDFQDK